MPKNLLEAIANEALEDLKKALESVAAQCADMVQSLAIKCEDKAMLAQPEDIEELADLIRKRFGLPTMRNNDDV